MEQSLSIDFYLAKFGSLVCLMVIDRFHWSAAATNENKQLSRQSDRWTGRMRMSVLGAGSIKVDVFFKDWHNACVRQVDWE